MNSLNHPKFKENFDKIRMAEENAREAIDSELKKKYFIFIKLIIFYIESKMKKIEKSKQKKNWIIMKSN